MFVALIAPLTLTAFLITHAARLPRLGEATERRTYASSSAGQNGLALGRSRYRLMQVTTTDIAGMSADNPEVRRELLFSLDIADAGNGRLAVTMRCDSAFFTVGTTSRQLQSDLVGAGWSGTVTRDGVRESGGLVAADGSPTDAAVLTPLAWVLPLLANGAADSVSVPVTSPRGPSRLIHRSFTTDDRGVKVKGTVISPFDYQPTVGGSKMKATTPGEMHGRWDVAAGVISAAQRELRLRAEFTVGAQAITRETLVVARKTTSENLLSSLRPRRAHEAL